MRLLDHKLLLICCTYPKGRHEDALERAAWDNMAMVNRNGSIENQESASICVASV
jgi:hypothetical protein